MPGGWRSVILALAVFVTCLGVYLPTVSSLLVNTDAAANSLAAWRLAQTGTPWMDGLDLRESGKVSHYGLGRDGHMVTTRTPGQIWAAAPFYLGTSSDQANWTFARGGIAAAVLTAGGVSLLFLGLWRRGTNLVLAMGGSAVFAFTTPVWSVSANALWTHPVTLLGLGGASWALSRGRWWLAGVWFGVAMTGRLHVAVIAAIVGLGLLWSRRSPKIAVCIGVPTLVTLGALSLWSYYVFASWDPRGAYVGHEIGSMVPTVSQGADGYLTNLAGFLVAPDRGLFIWTPVLLLLFPSVVRGWRQAPDWSKWLALGGVAYGLAQVGLNVFHGGDAFFGYRLALEPLIALTPVYVFCAPHAGGAARLWAPVLIGLQASAFLVGATLEGIVIPEAFVWKDNALWRSLRSHPVDLAPLCVLVAAVVAVLVRRLIIRAGVQPSLDPRGGPEASLPHTSST